MSRVLNTQDLDSIAGFHRRPILRRKSRIRSEHRIPLMTLHSIRAHSIRPEQGEKSALLLRSKRGPSGGEGVPSRSEDASAECLPGRGRGRALRRSALGRALSRRALNSTWSMIYRRTPGAESRGVALFSTRARDIGSECKRCIVWVALSYPMGEAEVGECKVKVAVHLSVDKTVTSSGTTPNIKR